MGATLCAATVCSCTACSALKHLAPVVFLLHGSWKVEPPYDSSFLLQKALGRVPGAAAPVQ